MNRHITEGAKVSAEMPKHLMNKTAEEIVAYMRDHYNCDHDPMTGKVTPLNKSTAYLEAVASALFNPQDWKGPIYAILPECGKEWAKAAIIWYHGAKPAESFVGVYSNGYACW